MKDDLAELVGLCYIRLLLKIPNISLGLARFRKNFYFVRRNIIRTINHDRLDLELDRDKCQKVVTFQLLTQVRISC